MNIRYSTALVFLFFPFLLSAQVNYTANDQVFQYQGQFRGGYNSGFAAGWSDLSIATLAAGDPTKFVIGVGLKSNRDALFFEALETQGYASKMEEVWHYDSLGLQDLTALIIGGEGGAAPEPPAPYRDTAHYCPTKQSTLFANLYTDIWDGGANGTPYNDENYFAAYMYKTVDQYKDFITFWEIWNEPGFDFSGNRGWRKQGDPEGNWWDNDPDPCDYKLHAPVQHYVRTLRIAWEIIKTLDPNSFVCMGAPGFPSFVDAVARNTDNPVDGSVTADYPLKGGAYFDAMCYHSFPHFDDSFVTSEVPFKIERNSDVAANSVIRLRDSFEGVLENYGYDGTTYPRKQFLITEINLPRKIFDYNLKTYGGEIAQRNFMMKAFLNCKIANIWQMHVYTFGELKSEADAVFEFELMGLYKNMDNTTYFSAQPTGAGVGVSTTAPLIWDTEHDPARSALLTNDDVRVEAFRRADGTYVYALWAIMKQDFNEFGTAFYSFPPGLAPDFLRKYEWKHSITGEKFISANHDITVDGTPVFLVEEDLSGEALPHFTVSPKEGCVPYQITYMDASQNADSVRWEFQNGTPQFSTDTNPTVSYMDEGYYTVTQTAYRNGQAAVNRQDYYMHARDLPQPGFVATFNFGNAFFLNTTFDADSVHWDFGDGGTSTEEFPAHTYTKNGKYEVTLTAINPCGTAVYKDSVEVLYALEVDFLVAQNEGCRPFTVQYQANAPLATEYKWFFPGGSPDTASIATPVVTYDTAGVYAVSLSVANGVSGGTITKDSFIVILEKSAAGFSYAINGLAATFSDTSSGTNTALLWDFGDGTTSTDSNPIHSYAAQGIYDVSLVAAGPCGADTTIAQVRAWEQPNAAFSADVTTGCAPLSVQFTNTGSSAIGNEYEWTFSGGIAATSDENPSLVFTAPGVYDVSFKISNPAGIDSIGVPQQIEVLAPTSADFTAAVQYLTVDFTNLTTDAADYLWHFGNGMSSMLPNPSFTYDSVGTYDVTLISYNSCSTDTVVYSISTFPLPPTAAFSMTDTLGCGPLAVQFFNESAGVVDSFLWNFPNGNPTTSTDENPIVSYDTPGTYASFFIVKNVSGSDTISFENIEVLPPAEADFTYQQQGYTLCFSTANAANFDSLIWDFGGMETSMDVAPCFTSNADSSIQIPVTLIAYNECGNDTLDVNVDLLISKPIAAIQADTTSGCAPLSVSYMANQTNVDSITWYFEGGEPPVAFAMNPSVEYLQGGAFTVMQIVENEFGVDTLTLPQYIDVAANPISFFGFTINSDTVRFQNQSTPSTSTFLWDFGNGMTSTEIDPEVVFLPGTYTVTLTTESPCGTAVYQQTVTILTSQSTLNNGTTIGVYPNPTNADVRLVVEGVIPTQVIDIQIFNELGQVVYFQKKSDVQAQIPMQDLPSGLYTIKLGVGSETAVLRVVKE